MVPHATFVISVFCMVAAINDFATTPYHCLSNESEQMPAPQTKILLSAALAAGKALRFTPNAADDFAATVGPRPAAPWLSAINDLNGDGRPDFIFGLPGDDDKDIDAGRIVVVLDAYAPGSTNGVTGGLNRIIIDGVYAGDRAGAAVGSVSDLDGDGIAEILVGAPGMDNGAIVDAGVAFVVWGSSVGGGVDLKDPYDRKWRRLCHQG